MRVNVGAAKTNLSQLLAQVEAGEEIEIARNGVPVARLSRIERPERPGERFLKGGVETAEELFVSVVSFIEIGVKASVGKLTIPRTSTSGPSTAAPGSSA
jgi:prevent-host-death family protein